jgi:hypothetical protein
MATPAVVVDEVHAAATCAVVIVGIVGALLLTNDDLVVVKVRRADGSLTLSTSLPPSFGSMATAPGS